ncbi:MAG: sucrose phosphorylase, partial [Lachnospiraceae bacterium]|nr:sucrose phosphorylase [Lachnospiraceae bacterium]
KDEIAQEVERPVVRKLLNMMEFRNETKALGGSFSMDDSDDGKLIIKREFEGDKAVLTADFTEKKFTVTHNGEKVEF